VQERMLLMRYVKANRDWLQGLKKGAVFVLVKTEFWNGEGHVIVKSEDGVVSDYPDVFFDDCDADGSPCYCTSST
jgi:hypothetical protein